MNSKYLLFGSFGLMLAALTALIALGLTRIESFDTQIHELTGGQNRKIGAVSELFLANGQRSALIDKLFAAETAQTRAGANGQYRRAIEVFSRAVERLRRLPVAAAEAAPRDEAIAAAAHAQDIGERIAGLLMRGETALASELNLTQAVLADSRLQETLYLLLEANHAETAQEIAAANQGMRAGFLLIGAGGILALLAGAVTGALAIRAVTRTEAKLEREKELAEVTLQSIVDGVITTDAAGLIEFMNPVAERFLGWTSAEARGRKLADVYRMIDERSAQPIEMLPASDGPRMPDEAMAVRIVDRSGRETPVRYSYSPIRGHDGTVHGMIVVFHDVSQLRAMAQQLIWQASHDALTGLVNRREFERRLAELIDTARDQGREHALLFMDLDGFKTVNDTCGHSAGDELLRQLTAVMQSRMRGSDTLARLGGDEFGALLEACPMDQALRIANAMRETVREFRFVWGDKTFSVGVSMGLVPVSAGSGDDVGKMLALADACCYEAKSKGRDRVQVYRPAEGDFGAKHAELAIVSQINRAFELGQFLLYRQRIAPLDPALRLEPHYEVLVRMLDRAGNLVPATGFMPAAERYNLLTSIERWVVSSLVEFLHRQWTAGTIPHHTQPGGARGYYSVNISGVSINDSSFPDFLRNLLTRYQLPSGLLCFEITETTAIANLAKAADLMRELKGFGCRLALDDFGTGMSSFTYLKYLPVDYLKIAGVFITDMLTDPMDHAIVDAVNRIAHILGMQTIAESVENAATLARLAELKIDYVQGYFIGEPEAFTAETLDQPKMEQGEWAQELSGGNGPLPGSTTGGERAPSGKPSGPSRSPPDPPVAR